MNWQDYKSAFEWDGTLRDIYVLNTDIQDWQKVLDYLRTSEWKLVYQLGGEDTELPSKAVDAFNAWQITSSVLFIDIGGPGLNCHFFTEDEIEFDMDPREFAGQAEFDHLLIFMRDVAQVLKKDVTLTQENSQNEVILKVRSGRN